MIDLLHILLFLLVIVLAVLAAYLFTKFSDLSKQIDELAFSKASQSVKYGKLTEQFIPFTKDFPFDSNNFRFIGTPVDGIAFSDDELVFCEFKTASSNLSPKQKNIKRLVEEKKVRWFEYKVR